MMKHIFGLALFVLFGLCMPLDAQEKTEKLTTGPKDDEEKVSPGPIDKNAKAKFETTESGLKYRILRKGKMDGKKAEDKQAKVTVHYKGWLDNKKIFDSSYRRDEKISFRLNMVIPGWTEGMQLVREGGMIELEIPAKLGYGDRNVGGGLIPPNSTLHFIVELYEVE